MPSRRAPKRRAEPSRASRGSSTGRRAAKPKGGRRAYRQQSHAAPTQRRAPKRSLPKLSMPVAAGATALVIAGVGAITVGSATGGDGGSGGYPALSSNLSAAGPLDTGARVDEFDPSRDISREVLEQQAEEQAEQRKQALKELAAKTDEHARDLKLNQWVLPLAGYQLTATFGETSPLWATVHTGLDFAAPTGTPLVAVAHGTITETTAYDAAYGNWTILTLDDGTEIWYCHQNTIDVSVGQEVNPGEQIGTVGYTGNVTGPHLHLEVRPDGGDPVDPYEVLQDHGVTP